MKQQSYQSPHNGKPKQYSPSTKAKREKSVTGSVYSSDTFVEDRLVNLNHKIQIQNEQIKERNGVINELRKNFGELAKIVEKQKKQKQDLMIENDFNQKTKQQMISKLRQKQQALSDENQKLKAILVEETQRSQRNRRENQALQNKINQLSAQIQTINEGIIEEEAELEEQVETMEKELSSVKELNMALVQQNRELKYRIEQNEEQVKQRNRRINQLEQQRSELEEEIKQQRKSLRTAKNTIEELKNTIQVPDMYSKMRMNQEIQHKQSLKASKKHQSDLIEQVQKLKVQNTSLAKGKNKVERDYERQRSGKKKIQSKYNQVQLQNREEMKRIERIMGGPQKRLQSMSDIVRVMEVQKQEKEKLEGKLKEIQEKYNKYKQYYKEISQKQPNVLILSAQEFENQKSQMKADAKRQIELIQSTTIRSIEQTKSNFNIFIHNINQSINMFEDNLVDKIIRIMSISSISKLGDISRSLKDMKEREKKRKEEWKAEVRRKDEVIKGREKEEERLRSSIALLKQKLQSVNKEKTILLTECEQIRMSMVVKDKQMNSYCEELERMKGENQRLCGELASERKSKERIVQKEEEKVKELSEKEEKLQKLRNENEELWAEVKRLREQKSKQEYETEVYLQKVEKKKKTELEFTIKQINKKYTQELRERAYEQTYLNNLVKEKLERMIEDHQSIKKEAVFYKRKFQELQRSERVQKSMDELPTKSRRERKQLDLVKKRRNFNILKTSME